MAIFGNFKGTTQSEFKIGKSIGNKIFTGELPSDNNSENGDLYLDSSAGSLQVYASNVWSSIGSTLTTLNVDNGTLIFNSANDTVSIGSMSSNEKLFVNGNLRLGTNPSLQYSGAYLDLRHSLSGTSVIRVRDNTTGTDPIFKVYTANNASEAFKVEGTITSINNYSMPVADGASGQAIVTDGSGNLTFSSIADPVDDYGVISEAADIVADYGAVIENDTRSPTGHDVYSVAETLELTWINPGDMVFVSDEIGGATMAFYDGTTWRRVQDRQIIS